MFKRVHLNRWALAGLVILLTAFTAHSQQIIVKNNKELNQAIVAAKPGDVIIMRNGEWKDTKIHFSANATVEKPVTLKAQTPGQVVLMGESDLVFERPYLIVEGLYFTNGGTQSSSVITFKSDYCRLTNTAIVDYNPEKFDDGYYWIYFSGNYNQADHCFFKGKNNMQPLVGNNQDDSRHNSVSWSYFKDIPYAPNNGREMFRIWGYGRSEETGDDGAYFTVEHNLFDHADGEGTEIISLKSNRNVVRFNTIIATRGGIVGRSGNFNTIANNFILGKGREGTTGIRVAGQGHKVYNNYISDITGDGLILITGEYIDKYLTPAYQPIFRKGTPLGRVPRYGQVKNGVFANNTFVNVGGAAIHVGASYNDQLDGDQRMLIPENNDILNNLIYHAKKGGIVMIKASQKVPLDQFRFKDNQVRNNLIFNAKVIGIDALISLTINRNPLLQLNNGLYHLGPNSPAIDKGVTLDSITADMDGQKRENVTDIGADEFSKNPIKLRPLSSKEVGVSWSITDK